MELFKETLSLFPPASSWGGRKMRRRRRAASSAARAQQVAALGTGTCCSEGGSRGPEVRGQGWHTPSPHPVQVKLFQVLEELQEPAQRHPAGHKSPCCALPSAPGCPSSARRSLGKAGCL